MRCPVRVICSAGLAAVAGELGQCLAPVILAQYPEVRAQSVKSWPSREQLKEVGGLA